jgi:hypothetical protein
LPENPNYSSTSKSARAFKRNATIFDPMAIPRPASGEGCTMFAVTSRGEDTRYFGDRLICVAMHAWASYVPGRSN